mgnify:CR=1 FL=1
MTSEEAIQGIASIEPFIYKPEIVETFKEEKEKENV